MPGSVSVIITCYNHGRFLAEAIDSALNQTVPPAEILVLDDGSTDHTPAVAAAFGSAIRYTRLEHSGPSRPRNEGLARARGDFIQFLDADDVLLPRKLEVHHAALAGVEGLAAALCDYRFGRADALDQPPAWGSARLSPRLDAGRPLQDLAWRWETELSIPIHCFLFDARLFRERGVRFDERLPNHVDWDCWMQMAAHPVRWIYVDEVLAVYRITPNSITKDRRVMRRGFVHAIEKHLTRHRRNPEVRDLLLRKRHQTLCRYDGQFEAALPRAARPVHRFLRRVYRFSTLLLWKSGIPRRLTP